MLKCANGYAVNELMKIFGNIIVVIIAIQINIFSEAREGINDSVMTLEKLKNTITPIVDRLTENPEVRRGTVNQFYGEVQEACKVSKFENKKQSVNYLFSVMERLLKINITDINNWYDDSYLLYAMPREILYLSWKISPKDVISELSKWQIEQIPIKLNRSRFVESYTSFF